LPPQLVPELIEAREELTFKTDFFPSSLNFRTPFFAGQGETNYNTDYIINTLILISFEARVSEDHQNTSMTVALSAAYVSVLRCSWSRLTMIPQENTNGMKKKK